MRIIRSEGFSSYHAIPAMHTKEQLTKEKNPVISFSISFVIFKDSSNYKFFYIPILSTLFLPI